MGMFDELEIQVACPICGKKVHGFQTKDLDCMMDRYNIGDFVGVQLRYVNTYASHAHEVNVNKNGGLGDLKTTDNCKEVWIDLQVKVDDEGNLTDEAVMTWEWLNHPTHCLLTDTDEMTEEEVQALMDERNADMAKAIKEFERIPSGTVVRIEPYVYIPPFMQSPENVGGDLDLANALRIWAERADQDEVAMWLKQYKEDNGILALFHLPDDVACMQWTKKDMEEFAKRIEEGVPDEL